MTDPADARTTRRPGRQEAVDGRPPTGAAPTVDHTVERYRQRRDEAASRRDALAGRARRVSNLRLLSFGVGVGALVWAELQPDRSPFALALFGLALLAFLVLIGVHARITERRRRAAALARVNEEGLARLVRDWDGLPRVAESAPPGHPYAHDLDLFGHGSVTRFLATTGTGMGRQRLHRWLLEPTPADAARRRQASVQELVPRLDYRQRLQVAGRLAGDPDPKALGAFADWAEAEPWLLRRPWLVWLTRIIPAATLVLLALHIDGAVARPWWILTLIAGTVLAGVYGKRVHGLFDRASLGDANLRQYAGLVAVIQEGEASSPRLVEIRQSLVEPCDARKEMERLGWLTELAELRHNGLFHALLHLPTLWDFHVLWGLERWQRAAGRHVREWADGVADLDALCALASPAFDEPGWSFPEIVDGVETVDARGLAHPLLGADERVANDVEVGPPGTFLMVTGSNMSGKSTLLRA
ncbi:MAG: hypothetical protein P8177_11740, partial [Gemmatimonadota bacterium]